MTTNNLGENHIVNGEPPLTDLNMFFFVVQEAPTGFGSPRFLMINNTVNYSDPRLNIFYHLEDLCKQDFIQKTETALFSALQVHLSHSIEIVLYNHWRKLTKKCRLFCTLS